jgi:hypothetical protein
MNAKPQNRAEKKRIEPRRAFYWLIGILVLFYVLRSCFPSLKGETLPPVVSESIQRSNINCLRASDTPFDPGYPQQPECGFYEVDMVEKGVVPSSAQATGVSHAICYQITVENPRWRTMGAVRMDIDWSSQNFSKVAILQDEEWQTFPDDDLQDEQRWLDYACPGEYKLE